ncbi:MAG: helix-turn-helix transcriptional regulator [Jatrophihabitantaceae bacterium]
MWEHYDEPLSLDDIADTAILSKFYFSRVFRSVTGTTPARFLTAIRLYRAKNLLHQTPFNVTDIVYMVGFNSLGTFTTRFSKSVGMSPSRFRTLSRSGLPNFSPVETTTHLRTTTMEGTVVLPPTSTPLRIYIGAFSSPIVEGIPVSCDLIDAPADGDRVQRFRLGAVPAGEWHVRVTAVAARWADVDPRPWARNPLFVGGGKHLVKPSDRTLELRIPMRVMDLTDVPILLALPELDSRFFPEPMLSAS